MTKSTYDILRIIGVFFVVLLFMALIGIGPVLTIMSINTLFLTQISFTIWTWLSMFWLQMATFGSIATILTSIKNKL